MRQNIFIAEPFDAQNIYNLECLCFDSNQYSMQNIVDMIEDNNYSIYLYKNADTYKIDAYLIIYRPKQSSTADIISVATAPSARRKGIAETLLKYAIESLKKSDAANLLLEVDKTNFAAISLYIKLGFQYLLTKPNYYFLQDGTRKDAFILELKI